LGFENCKKLQLKHSFFAFYANHIIEWQLFRSVCHGSAVLAGLQQKTGQARLSAAGALLLSHGTNHVLANLIVSSYGLKVVQVLTGIARNSSGTYSAKRKPGRSGEKCETVQYTISRRSN